MGLRFQALAAGIDIDHARQPRGGVEGGHAVVFDAVVKERSVQPQAAIGGFVLEARFHAVHPAGAVVAAVARAVGKVGA